LAIVLYSCRSEGEARAAFAAVFAAFAAVFAAFAAVLDAFAAPLDAGVRTTS
jgi:hypothetical protein